MTPSGRGRLGYYYGWNIVGVTVLAQLAGFGIAINCLSLYLPEWSRDLHAHVSALAFCYTAPGTVFCLLGPLTGYAAERFSARWMITVGLLGVSLLFVLASRVTEAWQLIALFATIAPVAMVISGFVPAQVLVTRWFDRRRGAAIGVSALGQTMAGAILPPILAIALPTIGWRPLFLIIAAFIALICAPIAFLLIRDRPAAADLASDEFADSPSAQDGATAAMSTRAILSRPNFWILGVCSVATGFLSAGFLVNLGPMAASQNLSPAQAASLLSILCLVALAAKLVTGFLIDRLGGRLVLASILAMGAAGVIVVQLIPGYRGLLIGTVLIASSSASLVPIAATVAREFGAEAVGRAMGMITFLGVIAVTAPPIVAFMNELTGGYQAPLVMLAAMGALSAAAALLLQQRKVEPVLAMA